MTTLIEEPLTSNYTFTNDDMPDASWTVARLTEFVRSLGKRTLTDRWRIGRAINLATANMTKANKDKWIAEALPGWSKSTVARLRKIATVFDSPDAIDECRLDAKGMNEKQKNKEKERRDAHKSAFALVQQLADENPSIKSRLDELWALVEKFAPSHPAR